MVTAHSGLDPPTSITNEGNASGMCSQANLTEAIFQLRISSNYELYQVETHQKSGSGVYYLMVMCGLLVSLSLDILHSYILFLGLPSLQNSDERNHVLINLVILVYVLLHVPNTENNEDHFFL